MELFVENISGIKRYLSPKQSYNILLGGLAVFFISLFFAWAKATSAITNLQDTGVSSGWSEKAYFDVLPFLYVASLVLRGKKLTILNALIEGAISFALLIYNNILNKSGWQETVSDPRWPSLPDRYNLGSDYGIGFWIGLLSLVALFLASIAWAAHGDASETGNKKQG